MEILMFSGSLRSGSLNRKLVHAAERILQSVDDVHATIVDIKSLNIPVYDGDIEASGIPTGVQELSQKITACQALILASPEYNGSIAGSFKNVIDWISRVRPVPLTGRPVLLMGASPGAFGAMSGLAAARTPFERNGCHLFHQSFALPKAHEAFDQQGGLKDPTIQKRLQSTLSDFVSFARRFS